MNGLNIPGTPPPPNMGSTSVPSLELERLQELSKETTNKLHIVWDEMGLSEELRTSQLVGLIEEVERVFSNKVVHEVALRDGYIKEVSVLENNLDNISQRLGKQREYFPHEGPGNLIVKITWLRGHLAQFEGIKEKRMGELEEMKERLVKIWNEMGEKIEEEFLCCEDYLTEDGLREYDARLNRATHEKALRIAAIQDMIKDITGSYDELGYPIVDDIDKSIIEGGESLGIDMDAVSTLSKKSKELLDEKISRTERLKQLGSQIQPLWEELGIPKNERTQFFMENKGLGMDVIHQCEMELDRLLDLKQEKMEELIQNAQQRIVDLWDEMQYTDEEREEFTQAHFMGPICEETLEAHNEEISILSEQSELYRPILELVGKYEKLCGERDDYHDKIKDPNRLLGRKGGNHLQLKAEEQQRLRIKKGFPVVIEKINKAIAEYEEKHGEFILNGQRFAETMVENERAFTAKLEEEKQRKKQAKSSNNTTPYKQHGTLGKRNPLGSHNK